MSRVKYRESNDIYPLSIGVKHLSWNTFEISFFKPESLGRCRYVLRLHEEEAYSQVHAIIISTIDTPCIKTTFNIYETGIFYWVYIFIEGLEESNNHAFEGETTRFRVEYTVEELGQLLQCAKEFVCTLASPSPQRCRYFYRDKPSRYYAAINQVMKVYTKDQTGDPLSPINGKLAGLFFGVKVDSSTGRPCVPSIYGDTRLTVPWRYFLNRMTNLYFADFYCMNAPHYVILVMTRSGTDADWLCQNALVELEWTNNPFLWRDPVQDVLYVAGDDIWVEVLCTDNVNITDLCAQGGKFARVQRLAGTKHIICKPKSPYCHKCNIPIAHLDK